MALEEQLKDHQCYYNSSCKSRDFDGVPQLVYFCAELFTLFTISTNPNLKVAIEKKKHQRIIKVGRTDPLEKMNV